MKLDNSKMKNKNFIISSSFPFIMAFLALMILGMALSPMLKVKLLHDRTLPLVTVSNSYGGANTLVVDSEVTSGQEERRKILPKCCQALPVLM